MFIANNMHLDQTAPKLIGGHTVCCHDKGSLECIQIHAAKVNI